MTRAARTASTAFGFLLLSAQSTSTRRWWIVARTGVLATIHHLGLVAG